MLTGGMLVESEGGRVDRSVDPATEEAVGRVPLSMVAARWAGMPVCPAR
ncbi:hypothetical protein [Streptomyces carpinensis]|uniref:Uncharacterized protein n=1 Tax=Streptomyces carpinensis TaxID=66369 RepID=A0ABV1VWY2_9ACTN|nr:hypothetical protein [Streptomyces carpinensis]